MKRIGWLALTLAAMAALGGCSGMMPKDADEGLGGNFRNDIVYEDADGEQYLEIDENRVKSADKESTVTFSLKVDTAAYGNVARYIDSGNLPPRDAVRTEELINYFSYEGALATEKDAPFALYTEIGPSPFDKEKHIAFIRVKTPDIDKKDLPPSNLTFLIDVSGSMDSYDKLPLLKTAFKLLVETLDEDDKVSIVTYASGTEIVLDSVSGADKTKIIDAIDGLSAGGSTAGESAIKTAYALAEKNLRQGGNNRVILATDGDFNVGTSDTGELAALVKEKKDGGVYLSVLGFGTGNIRDDIMETLSQNGNGNYAYIDTVATARKVLVRELGSSLYTVADDVKAQVDFKSEAVRNYRLIGYENRILDTEDFMDDGKDAGEIGVGTDVVVLFELELEKGVKDASALFDLRIRYKEPGGSESRQVSKTVAGRDIAASPSKDFGFACSVAAFGHLLRGSEYAGEATIRTVRTLAEDNIGRDTGGYRQEFLALLAKYDKLA